jgi:FtsP/CotA-like multicopper oxidase with cupredoxin domain
MGERVDATIAVQASVPVIAAAEGKDGYARLDLRVSGAPDVKVDEFVRTLRTTPTLNSATLAAAPDVQLPQRNPDQTIDVRLAGPVNGYTWPINGRLYDPLNNGLAVSAGQRLRVRLINDSKMFHPIHLHGHTFQVLLPSGPAARKDTVLVPPLQTVEFDFDTDNPVAGSLTATTPITWRRGWRPLSTTRSDYRASAAAAAFGCQSVVSSAPKFLSRSLRAAVSSSRMQKMKAGPL